jgi:hypothetical protein
MTGCITGYPDGEHLTGEKCRVNIDQDVKQSRYTPWRRLGGEEV